MKSRAILPFVNGSKLVLQGEMASRYTSVGAGAEEEVHLMNEDESLSSSPSPVNRKSLVIFFGVTAVAAAIVICTVMVTVYSGKRYLQYDILLLRFKIVSF